MKSAGLSTGASTAGGAASITVTSPKLVLESIGPVSFPDITITSLNATTKVHNIQFL